MLNFEDNFYFDENLWERPKNKDVILARINQVHDEMLDDEDVFDRIKSLGELGYLHRTLLKLEIAESYLGQAMTLIEEDDLGGQYYVKYGIQLAHVWKWQKRFEESSPMLDGIIDVCEKVDECKPYLDFAYQHTGKNYFDQSKYQEALEQFEKALKIRVEKKIDGLIQSSELAVKVTKERMSS